jgi:hypothetical protein
MQIHCPTCGALIPAEDLNLQTLLARCRNCNNVFGFSDVARAETVRSAGRTAGDELAPEIPCPPRIHVEETANMWTAHWRWFSPAILFLIVFCIAWDSFLIFWYSIAFTHKGPWLMVVFPIAHVAVGVSLTYFVIASLLNTTRVTATRSELSIQSAPMPWIGNRVLPASTVRQIFSRITISNSNSNLNNNYGSQRTIGVFAVLDDGRTIRLIGGLKDSDEANFLQQQLKKRLNLKPSPLAN